MLYKKYQLYENKIEIMIPSDYDYNDDVFSLGSNSWNSKDKTISINLNLSDIQKDKKELTYRLQEYYLGYKKTVDKFVCEQVTKRKIYDRYFGEIDFSSNVMGYHFYNCQLISLIEDKELTVSLQCLSNKKQDLEHVFNIIKDSVKINKEVE